MYELPTTAIAAWIDDGPRSHPSVVGWVCPHCTHFVSFSSGIWNEISPDHWHTQALCPRCQGRVQLFTLNVGTGHKSLAGGRLYMFPPSSSRSPSNEILETNDLPESVKSAYRSAINIVSTQEWSASAVMCRRLLEGITKSILPAELQSESLAKQLEALPKYRDLTRPVLELADAVRKGGNLGAHSDLAREPNEQMATLMLDLCEDLMEYLFAVPARINELQIKLETLGRSAGKGN